MYQYPLAKNVIDENDIDALCKWFKKGERLTKGPLTVEFEKKWAAWVGRKYAVFCNSGSSANLLMASAAKFSNGSRNRTVVVPSVGWATTISPFIQLEFYPIMCGADAYTLSLDGDHLESLLKKLDPACVMMVQVLGVPADMDLLYALREKYNFLLLEDACAACGAEYNGKKVGSFGDMASFSFYYGHHLSTIEGGMVVTDSEHFYYLLLLLRSHGWGKDLPSHVWSQLMNGYEIDEFHEPFTFFVPGFNVRSTDVNAFLGLRQLAKADRIREIRTRNHYVYAENLKNVMFQKWPNKAVPCSISFGALACDTEHRKRIAQALDRHSIETRLFSAGNLGLHPFWFERYGEFHHSVSDAVHRCGFFLPNNESMTEKDIGFICGIVNSVS